MRITIGSGKGGTGKTTVAVSFALSLARRSVAVQLLDADVEEPNAHLFLPFDCRSREAVTVDVPEIDADRCIACGACADFCKFNALAALPDKVLVFPELCHSCGGCMRVCPVRAVSYRRREVGIVEMGSADGLQFGRGRLAVGEARATPVIAQLKRHVNPTRLCIVDAPAGTSCPFVESVQGSDICLLIAEPTPFGLNDLKLAVEVTDMLNIPRAVMINRAGMGDAEVERYCVKRNVPVLASIPHERAIAEAYAVGQPLVDARPAYGELLWRMYKELQAVVREPVS